MTKTPAEILADLDAAAEALRQARREVPLSDIKRITTPAQRAARTRALKQK